MNPLKEFVYRLRGEYTTERLVSMGMHVGKDFKRLKGVILDPSHCWLIDIGDRVTMAPGVHILCHDASTKTALGYTKIGRVTIGNNVFIGASSVVLPGPRTDGRFGQESYPADFGRKRRRTCHERYRTQHHRRFRRKRRLHHYHA